MVITKVHMLPLSRLRILLKLSKTDERVKTNLYALENYGVSGLHEKNSTLRSLFVFSGVNIIKVLMYTCSCNVLCC